MAGFVKKNQKSKKFASGGSKKMFSKQQAEPQTPGHTGDRGVTGKGATFASGGRGKMFGFSPSLPAGSGRTSAR